MRSSDIGGLRSMLATAGTIENVTVITGGEIKSDLKETIHFKNVVFQKTIMLNGTLADDQVIFERCDFKKGISFVNFSFSHGLRIKDCSGTMLKFISCGFDELLVEDAKFEKIEFKNIVKEWVNRSDEIKISRTHADQLLIKAKEVNASVTLSGSTCCYYKKRSE